MGYQQDKTSLPSDGLQVWNTGTDVGNTRILQSFTATASHRVYLQFSGVTPEQPCGALSAHTPS